MELFLRVILITLRYAFCIGCISYKISVNKNLQVKIEHVLTRKRKWYVVLGKITYATYMIHMLVQTYIQIKTATELKYDEATTIAIQMKMVQYCFVYGFPASWVTFHWIYEEDLQNFLQRYLTFYLQNSKKLPRQTARYSNGLPQILGLVMFALLIVYQNHNLYKRMPNEVNFLTAWISMKTLTDYPLLKTLLYFEYLHFISGIWVCMFTLYDIAMKYLQ